MNPDWWVTPEISMLRQIELDLRHLAYVVIKAAGGKNVKKPKPLPLTSGERIAETRAKAKAGGIRFDRVPREQLRKRLGWTEDGRRTDVKAR